MQTSAYLKITGIGFIVAIIALLSALVAIERERRHSAEIELNQVVTQRDSLIEQNKKQLVQIKAYNEIGTKNAAELSSAQQEIDRLSDRLRTGPDRVYVQADCPTAVLNTTSTGSVGDATAARLTETAQQDYLHLRRMMAENRQQTKYLQDYIRTQCLNQK